MAKNTLVTRRGVLTPVEDIRDYFTSEGCQLLSESYTGSKQKLKYLAKCGHERSISLYDFRIGKGRYCRSCTAKRRVKRHSYGYVKNYFKEYGCKLLSTDYKNNSTNLDYICSCGNVSTISFASFRRGSRCDYCKRSKLANKARKYTIEDVRKIFREKNCVLLEQKYVCTKTKMKYVCKCGRENEITLNHFLYGDNFCKECKREALSGSNHYLWNPELTEKERSENKSRNSKGKFKTWRLAVFKRDNFTCQKCSSRKSGTLNAHHLDGYNWCKEKRTDIDNGVTLCETCHSEFHMLYGWGDNTKEQYTKWVNSENKYLLKKKEVLS